MIATTYTIQTLSSFGGSTTLNGQAGSPFVIEITPNGYFSGNISVVLQGGGLTNTLNFVYNHNSLPQSQEVTPTSYGNVLITPTSSPSITDAAPITYGVLGIDEATTPTLNPYAPVSPTITFLVNLNSPPVSGQGISINDYQSQFKTVSIPNAGTFVNGNTFTLQGSAAFYVYKNYTSQIVDDYTSYPLMVLEFNL